MTDGLMVVLVFLAVIAVCLLTAWLQHRAWLRRMRRRQQEILDQAEARGQRYNLLRPKQ